MRSELSVGSARVAAVWTACSSDDDPEDALVRGEVGAEQLAQAHQLTSIWHSVPCRNRSTMSAAGSGSAVITGWVSDNDNARKSRAASGASMRSRSGSAANSAVSAGLSGSGLWSGSLSCGPMVRAATRASRCRRCGAGSARSPGPIAARTSRWHRSRKRRARTASGRGPLRATADMSSSLSAKTLKIVPSDTPAAVAIWRVVTAEPCSTRSGMTASMIADSSFFRRHRCRTTGGGTRGGHGRHEGRRYPTE